MKSLVICVAFMASASAFANPFENFSGIYGVVGTPQVAMAGMSYCDWQGFREMTGLTISLQDGVYVGDLASKIDNAPMHSFTTFREYSYSGEFGVRNTAKITGDSSGARFETVDSSQEGMTVSEWSISVSSNKFHLRMLYSTKLNSPTVASCIYDVDLQKK